MKRLAIVLIAGIFFIVTGSITTVIGDTEQPAVQTPQTDDSLVTEEPQDNYEEMMMKDDASELEGEKGEYYDDLYREDINNEEMPAGTVKDEPNPDEAFAEEDEI